MSPLRSQRSYPPPRSAGNSVTSPRSAPIAAQWRHVEAYRSRALPFRLPQVVTEHENRLSHLEKEEENREGRSWLAWRDPQGDPSGNHANRETWRSRRVSALHTRRCTSDAAEKQFQFRRVVLPPQHPDPQQDAARERTPPRPTPPEIHAP